MVEAIVFVVALVIILVPVLRAKPKPIEYEEREFLSGKLFVPKD